MSFPFYIARRYLFSRKRVGAINIISAISMAGVMLSTMAMVCVLSGFNGFREVIASLFTAMDPQLCVVPARGKFFQTSDKRLQAVRTLPEVSAATFTLEDNALILFQGRPTVITLKGVDADYRRVTGIDSILYGQGSFELQRATLAYGVPGIDLAQQMGGPDFGKVEICVPKKGEKINTANPIENISVGELYASGLCFQLDRKSYDSGYMLAPLGFAQTLFEQPERATRLELRLRPGANEQQVARHIAQVGGGYLRVLDRYAQHEDTFRVMRLEKFFAYCFLAFIALVASFNIIGSVSMLIIDKRSDVATLRQLGATQRDVARIFLFEGRLIAVLGAVLGVVLGLVLCWLQQTFGLLRLGGDASRYIIAYYPVSVHATDVLLVLLTAVAVGFLAVWYPVRYLSRRLA